MTPLEDKNRYIRNINKLSLNRSTNCGEFGIVKCDHEAYNFWSNKRLFIVSKSKKLRNGGSWTYSSLRKAILTAD